ncbi:MAG: DNA repair protein RadA [Phycisphaerales bacterium]|nr:DNA repair protein RadA [Phycisphaerales bacterium]
MIAKVKTSFFCTGCGHESPKWIGKCPSCNQWNTFVEEVVEKEPKQQQQDWKADAGGTPKNNNRVILLDDVEVATNSRIITNDVELNRVLGGGIVYGSIILFAGEPGIGKSTLLLQIGLQLTNKKILYISGEESEQQIKMRANRIDMHHNQFYLLSETSVAVIVKEIKFIKPDLVIVDSIQTVFNPLLESSAGSITQVRDCAATFQRFAKETNTPVFMIGHINKEGVIAGPKVLEHMVDAVLQFEGDTHFNYRIIRTLKNRFGSTSELGIYEMTVAGMRAVVNPSELFISQKQESLSGSAIAVSMEGLRPLLLEVQALVTQSAYGTSQRTVNGFDTRKLQLLLAILEKRGGYQFFNKDVFLNFVGGIKVDDPSLDLAIAVALLSSYKDIAIPPDACFAGEIGLNGVIRAVNRIEQRITEAERLGFTKMYVSSNHKNLPKNKKINLIALQRIEDLTTIF